MKPQLKHQTHLLYPPLRKVMYILRKGKKRRKDYTGLRRWKSELKPFELIQIDTKGS